MASRFWVGGTGTWDSSDTTHWAASSGGAGGQSVPTTSDSVTFDGSSGGGTCTLASGTVNMSSFACGAFTGTIDSSVNNPTWNCTGNWSYSGSGTRTVKLGTSTINLSGNSSLFGGTTSTNLTFSGNSGVIVNFTASGGTGTRGLVISSGMSSTSHGNITVSACSGSGAFWLNNSGNNSLIKSLSVTGPNLIMVSSSITHTITDAVAINGTASGAILWSPSSAGTAGTVAIASGSTASWNIFRQITFSGNTMTATNSFDLGGNTLLSVTGPTIANILGRHPGLSGGFI